MKFLSLRLFLAATLTLLAAAMCTPAKNKETVKTETKSDTIPASIMGKVVFRIKNSDFFTNAKRKKINSVDEFRNYIPVYFYEKNGYFYIPNRLDNFIYSINDSGKVIEKISIPEETDIAHFYITGAGEKYILNHKGLTVYDKENNKVNENARVIFITPDLSNDNLLVTSRYGDQDDNVEFADKILERTDIRKIMREPLAENVHYSDYYFDDQFLFEMSYDSLAGDGPKEGSIIFKKYDLHMLKLISENSVAMKCRNCFHMPNFLSERLVVASNFSNKENPVNELFLFGENGYKKFELTPPIKAKPLNDVMYIGRMPLNYNFSLEKNQKKLYSLATTETEVVVMEYELPEVR